jgi:tetratricopeptide (TPR) repeat protein
MESAARDMDDAILLRWPGLQRLIDEGRFVDTVEALDGAEGVRELVRTSRSPEARLRLARILSYGGNPRGAHLLTERTAREWPDHPECRAEWLLQLSGTSPVEALLYLDRHGEAMPEGLSIDMAASWLHGRALVATQLRLFDDAHRISEEARERIAGHPWSLLIGASTLLAEDRREEARLATIAALARFPRSGYGHRLLVQILSVLGRGDEAVAHAEHALGLVQVPHLAEMAAAVLVEQGDRAQALEFLDRAIALSPLADRSQRMRLLSLRLEGLFLEGRVAEAREVAETLVAFERRSARGDGRRSYARRILDALAADDFPTRRRTVLPVPFVAQDHMTCSPAALAAIAGRWREGDSIKALHDVIAEEICTDGTPRELSRAWADRNGWVTAEFVPDAASARLLIARGVPFAIHTAWLGGAHSQTLMGFDERTETAVVREPSIPRFIEFRLDLPPRVLPAQTISALAMVPADSPEAETLRTLDLPKRAQFDLAHRMRLSWREGDEAAAERAFEELRARFPDDDVTLLLTADRARRYSNEEALSDALSALYARYPDDDILVRLHAAALENIGKVAEVEAVWTRALARRRAAPGLRVDRMAQLLATDADSASIRETLLRAMRDGHSPSECLVLLAMLAERDGRPRDAERLLRINSFLAPSHESSARRWIDLAHRNGTLAEVIAELDARIASGGAAERQLLTSLTGAMWMRGLRAEACARIEREAKERPEDLELAMRCVRFQRAFGRLDDAERSLEALANKVNRLEWVVERALIARARGSVEEQKLRYRELLELDPASMLAWDGLRDLAADPRALDDLAGELERHFARMPAYWPVASVLTAIYSDRDPGRGISVLERHLAEHPRNAGALMHLAQLQQGVGNLDAGVAAARRACEVAPHPPGPWSVLSDLLFASGDLEGSREAAERSLAIEANPLTVDRVTRALPDPAARTAWLRPQWTAALGEPRSPERLHALLLSSMPPLALAEVAGFIETCARTPEFEDVHASLVRLALRARDWERAVALSLHHLAHYGHSEDAHALRFKALWSAGRREGAIAAAERWCGDFPHSARALSTLADIHSQEGDQRAAIAPLERIVALRPDDLHAASTLAFTLAQLKRGAEGVAVLDRVWARAPSAALGWSRIDLAVELGDKDAAARAIRDLLPHLHEVNGALIAVDARINPMVGGVTKGTGWIRRLWRHALETADDASPAGVRAAWALVAISRHSVGGTMRLMSRRFKERSSIEDALEGLVFVATNYRFRSLTRRLARDHSDALRRRPSSFVGMADALWVARRRSAVRAWLAPWRERGDLSGGPLLAVARILDALDDHDAAIAAATRGLPLASPADYPCFLAIRAVALVGRGDPASLEEARVFFSRILECSATPESTAIAEWATKAFTLLDTQGRPDKHALAGLERSADEIVAVQKAPIVTSMLRGFGRIFVARGASILEFGYADTWWRALSWKPVEMTNDLSAALHHLHGTVTAPFNRLVGSERSRFDGMM